LRFFFFRFRINRPIASLIFTPFSRLACTSASPIIPPARSRAPKESIPSAAATRDAASRDIFEGEKKETFFSFFFNADGSNEKKMKIGEKIAVSLCLSFVNKLHPETNPLSLSLSS